MPNYNELDYLLGQDIKKAKQLRLQTMDGRRRGHDLDAGMCKLIATDAAYCEYRVIAKCEILTSVPVQSIRGTGSVKVQDSFVVNQAQS